MLDWGRVTLMGRMLKVPGIYDWSTSWFASRCAWPSAAMSESHSYLTAAEWPRWSESMTSNQVCTNILMTAGANWHPCWQSQWSYWIKQSTRLVSSFDVHWQELAEKLFFSQFSQRNHLFWLSRRKFSLLTRDHHFPSFCVFIHRICKGSNGERSRASIVTYT